MHHEVEKGWHACIDELVGAPAYYLEAAFRSHEETDASPVVDQTVGGEPVVAPHHGVGVDLGLGGIVPHRGEAAVGAEVLRHRAGHSRRAAAMIFT